MIFRTNGLRGILNQKQFMFLSQFFQGIHFSNATG